MMEKGFNWTEYYNNHRNSKPTRTLLKGLKYLDNNEHQLPKTSIDIGCGQGTDTAELLRQGWNVLAVDKESEAEEIVRNRLSKFHGKELTIIVQKMESIIIFIKSGSL